MNAPNIDCGLWKREVEDDDVVRERRAGGAGPLDTKNGREIVVTRMEFFSNALSETSAGRKLIKTSKGRWDGSGRGNVCDDLRLRVNLPDEDDEGRNREVGREGMRDSEERCVDELPGELGVLCEPLKRKTFGGASSP